MTRVLVVDDEIDTLNLLRTILEISGYEAFTTLNSVDAITLAEVEHPDCILLDIMMPQLDGFTLCKMMRLHPATANLPIVFVTAYSALDLEDRRREAGADMVLPKPIGMDVLIEAVQKATTMGHRPESARAPIEAFPSPGLTPVKTATGTHPIAPTSPLGPAPKPVSPPSDGDDISIDIRPDVKPNGTVAPANPASSESSAPPAPSAPSTPSTPSAPALPADPQKQPGS
jgi:CheY-like chemotaxis protein